MPYVSVSTLLASVTFPHAWGRLQKKTALLKNFHFFFVFCFAVCLFVCLVVVFSSLWLLLVHRTLALVRHPLQHKEMERVSE